VTWVTLWYLRPAGACQSRCSVSSGEAMRVLRSQAKWQTTGGRKALLLRYGGLRARRQALPFFLGLLGGRG